MTRRPLPVQACAVTLHTIMALLGWTIGVAIKKHDLCVRGPCQALSSKDLSLFRHL